MSSGRQQRSVPRTTAVDQHNPPRICTDDRSLDEAACFCRSRGGRHPVGAPYDCDLFDLQLMAGPNRVVHRRSRDILDAAERAEALQAEAHLFAEGEARSRQPIDERLSRASAPRPAGA